MSPIICVKFVFTVHGTWYCTDRTTGMYISTFKRLTRLTHSPSNPSKDRGRWERALSVNSENHRQQTFDNIHNLQHPSPNNGNYTIHNTILHIRIPATTHLSQGRITDGICYTTIFSCLCRSSSNTGCLFYTNNGRRTDLRSIVHKEESFEKSQSSKALLSKGLFECYSCFFFGCGCYFVFFVFWQLWSKQN